MPIRKVISLRLPRITMGKETLENAAKIKVMVYPWRSDLRNLFFIPLWKPMTDNRIAAGRKKNIRYSPRVRSGLPQPEENFSRQIPVIPRSMKKIERAIFIFLGMNFNFMILFRFRYWFRFASMTWSQFFSLQSTVFAISPSIPALLCAKFNLPKVVTTCWITRSTSVAFDTSALMWNKYPYSS